MVNKTDKKFQQERKGTDTPAARPGLAAFDAQIDPQDRFAGSAVASHPFWEKPLGELNAEEWEALCDGCGLCCLNKVEDEDMGVLTFTSIACDLFDCKACRCTDYTNRKARVPDCVSFTPGNVKDLDWLPPTCAYVLRDQGQPLYKWHYLISGSRASVHEAGISARGKVTAFEKDVPLEDYELHAIELPKASE